MPGSCPPIPALQCEFRKFRNRGAGGVSPHDVRVAGLHSLREILWFPALAFPRPCLTIRLWRLWLFNRLYVHVNEAHLFGVAQHRGASEPPAAFFARCNSWGGGRRPTLFRRFNTISCFFYLVFKAARRELGGPSMAPLAVLRRGPGSSPGSDNLLGIGARTTREKFFGGCNPIVFILGRRAHSVCLVWVDRIGYEATPHAVLIRKCESIVFPPGPCKPIAPASKTSIRPFHHLPPASRKPATAIPRGKDRKVDRSQELFPDS